MRLVLTRSHELADLRGRLRDDLQVRDVPVDVVEDVVLVVNEATASALAVGEIETDRAVGGARVDVRWSLREGPPCEVRADIRLLGGTPHDLDGDALRARVVGSTASHVSVETLVGGASVTIRRRFDRDSPGATSYSRR